MKFRASLPLVALLPLLGATFVPRLASAHINVSYPPTRYEQNSEGDPQKMPPCGGEDGGVKTNIRTKFKPGATIQVMWTETIYHPGFFRISFDDAGDDAFKDPQSLKDIQTPPRAPILLDGLFSSHKAKNSWMAQVTLPNISCKTCTLQIIQFMSDTASRVYHHCVDLELTSDAPTTGTVDAGTDAAVDAAKAGGADANQTKDSSPPGNTDLGNAIPEGKGGASGQDGAVGMGTGGQGGVNGSGGRVGGNGGSGTGGTAEEGNGDSPARKTGCTYGGGETGTPGLGVSLACAGIVVLARRRRRR